MRRHAANPIITAADVPPSHPQLRVVGVFNAGAVRCHLTGDVILLLRVAEQAVTDVADGGTNVVLRIPMMVPRVATTTEGADRNDVDNHNPQRSLELRIVTLRRDDVGLDFSDSRVVFDVTSSPKRIVALTSLSHIRLARSQDGVRFTIGSAPFIFPEDEHESWGCEDARILWMPEDAPTGCGNRFANLDDFGRNKSDEPSGGERHAPIASAARASGSERHHDGGYYVMSYTAVSPFGAATALCTSKDLVSVNRLGIAFPVENKDVCIFPRKIDGRFVAYHRPVPKSIGNPDIWMAESDDLIHWGKHRRILGGSNPCSSIERALLLDQQKDTHVHTGALSSAATLQPIGRVATSSWDNGRIGGGAPSIETARGWVHFFHAADERHRYCLGALLTPLNDPSRIIARSAVPILTPDADCERFGFFGNVVFTCGVVWGSRNRSSSGKVADDDLDAELLVYYGAADDKMCLASISLRDLFSSLDVVV